MRKTRQKKLKATCENKKGFGIKTNVGVNMLVEFQGGEGRQRGVVKCIHPFGKVGTILVKEFLGENAYIVGIDRVELV